VVSEGRDDDAVVVEFHPDVHLFSNEAKVLVTKAKRTRVPFMIDRDYFKHGEDVTGCSCEGMIEKVKRVSKSRGTLAREFLQLHNSESRLWELKR
jgi:hypothetical protein